MPFWRRSSPITRVESERRECNDRSAILRLEVTMVRQLISITIERGKVAEARQWAREVAAYAAKTHSIQVQAFAEVFGNVGTIYWTVDHADLASLVQYMERMDADPEYQGI